MSEQSSGLTIEDLKKEVQKKITDIEIRIAITTLELTTLKIKIKQLDRLIQKQTN